MSERDQRAQPPPAVEAKIARPNERRERHGRDARRAAAVDALGRDRGDVFATAVEMTPMPMILTDPNQPDNPIVFANAAFLTLVGYDAEEVLGRNCRFLQGAQTDPAGVAHLREAIAARRPAAVELLNYRRDGSPFWNAISLGPVFGPEGELLYFFGNQLDVTRRREAEMQAQKMEAIGQLTAGLAHDFNNLLQVVIGNLDIMRGKLDDDHPLKKYVTNALTAADRGAKITRHLVSFARKARLEPKEVDVSQLVSDFLPLIETTLGGNYDLQMNLRRRPPRVRLDPNQFEAALLGVVTNARDAMPEGGLITVSTGVATGPDGIEQVFVEVRDEGPGMSAELAAKAVQPFFTTKPPGKGTGLGLAMADGFARQSGGRLEIDAEEARGAAVRLCFPTAAGPALARPVTAAAPVPGRRAPPARLLVVEDSEAVRELAVEVLKTAGYQVTALERGREALDLLRAAADGEGFDLLFTDIVMPGGVDGLTLAREAARLAPEMPVLLATGYNEDLVARGPDWPDLDVLGKPYQPTELTDRVRRALNHSRKYRPVP